MADYAMRPCGGSWAYCNGDCSQCPEADRTYTTNGTEKVN